MFRCQRFSDRDLPGCGAVQSWSRIPTYGKNMQPRSSREGEREVVTNTHRKGVRKWARSALIGTTGRSVVLRYRKEIKFLKKETFQGRNIVFGHRRQHGIIRTFRSANITQLMPRFHSQSWKWRQNIPPKRCPMPRLTLVATTQNPQSVYSRFLVKGFHKFTRMVALVRLLNQMPCVLQYKQAHLSAFHVIGRKGC
jgi:hypothetical protein